MKQLFYVQDIFFNETTTKESSLMPLQSSILQQYFYIKRKGLHQSPLFKLANCKRIHEFNGKKEIIFLVYEYFSTYFQKTGVRDYYQFLVFYYTKEGKYMCVNIHIHSVLVIWVFCFCRFNYMFL